MFDPTADLPTLVDGLEPVALQRRGVVLCAVEHAWRGPVGEREAASGGAPLGCGDVPWMLPEAECAAAPALGDVLVDRAGGRWTVLSATLSVRLARWDCTCRNVALAYGLNDLVTIQRAAYSKDAEGVQVEHWRTWRSGVRARIQPQALQVVAEEGVRQTVRRCRIHLAEDLAIDHACRIVAPDAAVYRIVGSSGTEQIGGLQTLEAERIS